MRLPTSQGFSVGLVVRRVLGVVDVFAFANLSFRIERPQSDYTTVCNAILRDKRSSLRAKGLYALMYSKPADWIFYEAALVGNQPRAGMQSALRCANSCNSTG